MADGRVTVNGRVAELGARAAPGDVVEVDGLRVDLRAPATYYALHKPAGVVTTARDPQGRPTVTGLVPAAPRVFAIGRLDLDTSGLLLMTDDGDFANRIAHPRYRVPKVYVAEVDGTARRRHLDALRAGVEIGDGPAAADRVRVRATSSSRTVLELQVHDGRNRMVRRMLGAVGLPVQALVRVAVGPVSLGGLAQGAWRTLDRDEVHALLAVADTGEGSSSRRHTAGEGRQDH